MNIVEIYEFWVAVIFNVNIANNLGEKLTSLKS